MAHRYTRRGALWALGGLAGAFGLGALPGRSASRFAVSYTDAQWRARLAPAAYDVLRHGATEIAGSSPLDSEKRPGIFACAGCQLPLFDAKTKFDSGTGWPSFYRPLSHAVETSNDYAMLEPRTEVRCRRCGGHLGHVFNDGPPPTGLRYCMNGVALAFHPRPPA